MAEIQDWQELTGLTQGAPMVVERVRLACGRKENAWSGNGSS